MSDRGSVDFDALAHVEESAFQRGYRGGYEHGAAHGRADGGNLGAHHGFSVWAELGYYEGLARTWILLLQGGEKGASRVQAKQAIQISKFLELIDQFPTENHSASEPQPEGLHGDDLDPEPQAEQAPPRAEEDEDEDISQLLARIRAKYRQLARGLNLGAPVYSFAPEEAFTAASAKPEGGAALAALAQTGGVDPVQLRY